MAFFENPPEGAQEEIIALTNDCLKTDMFGDSEYEDDIRPELRATQVSFYDQEGHLIPFDFNPDDIMRGKEVYFAGYLKSVIDDSQIADGGIPVSQVGPLTEWWIGGYETGKTNFLLKKI